MPIDYLKKRPSVVSDTECYPNLWVIGFKDRETKKKVIIPMYEGVDLDRQRIAKVLFNFRVYTFNGISYDMPMISYALKGASNFALKKLNDEIIPGGGKKGLQFWEVYDRYDMGLPNHLDHIDLWHVSPAASQMCSLKNYAGRMHSKRMQDLPYPPETVLTPTQIGHVLDYLGNDLDNTEDLSFEMQPQIELRAQISAKYGLDFRSKSDAQCGEAVVRHLVEKRVGHKIYKPDIQPGTFKFECPPYIKFQTPYMQGMLDKLLRADFTVRYDGYVELPDLFQKKKGRKDQQDYEADIDGEFEGGEPIRIGTSEYRMGIGGLHSSEKSVSYFADDDHYLVDTDVTSYYPFLMLRSGREPDNMRGHFVPVFQGLVDERVSAKTQIALAIDKLTKDAFKSLAESLKIFINGLFGKTGSPWSIVYAPKMMIQTTVGGQLSILMLIEALELRGFGVKSANTDGFVTMVPIERYAEFCAVVMEWEWDTGLKTEYAKYSSLHSANVNNYVAFIVEKDGKPAKETKRKGWYAPGGRGIPAALGLKKTPNGEICQEAAIKFLEDGTPPERTVRNCQDIRKFVVVRKVTGGCLKDGEFVGKVVRYYLSDETDTPLTYITSGNKVPSSEGAWPCMELPDELPQDIDYAWYEREAYAVLHDMGMDVLDPTLRGRAGTGFGRRDDQKTVHLVDWATGIAGCGVQRKSRRDLWVEYKEMPSDFRLCAKCRKGNEL